MKKEAVNTFSNGLVYDLNPITTPNNVLTDCVNGTFVTFNGDELALQNDAGNTKILVSQGTPETTVNDSIRYGRLYNWYAITDPRGIAPTGWHVPTAQEWDDLRTFLGASFAGGKLKETGNTYWGNYNYAATNDYGFNARGAGYFNTYNDSYTYQQLKGQARFWCADESSSDHAYTKLLDTYQPSIIDGDFWKTSGLSVRLIKDDSNDTGDIVVDGYTYNCITIGTQVWLQQNLAVTHYQNGDLIGSDFTVLVGAVTSYNNDENNVYNFITTPAVPDKYVSLTEGFYPIGVKEFGGVLYIVSGKTPVSTEWGTSGSYPIGAFVHDSNGAYYKSLINSNNDTLPTYTNTSWERMESWNTFANTYGQIEFGSYPSPQILTEESVGNGIEFVFDDPTESSLFTSHVLNNYIFKAGEYVMFEGLNLDLSNVTRYTYSDNIRISSDLRIYNVKLYLQLTNGFIDLTTDVWNEYARFKGGSLSNLFWFNDPDFKYYCKNNFKGKLVMSVELEDLPTFKLNYYNIDQQDGVGYLLNLNITIDNQTMWNITHLRVNYSLDGWLTRTWTDIAIGASTDDYTITIPFSSEGSTVEFKVTPVFYNPSTTDDVTDELPVVYLNKYTLIGSELLTNVFNYDSNDYEGVDYY